MRGNYLAVYVNCKQLDESTNYLNTKTTNYLLSQKYLPKQRGTIA